MPPTLDARTLTLFAWSLIVAGFLSGATLGLFFHRDDFLGGYASFRRRLLRLGHIACIALGLIALQLLDTLATLAAAQSAPSGLAATTSGALPPAWLAPAFLAGALLMPTVCFLTAWRRAWRHLFALPVALLVAPIGALLCELARSLPRSSP